MDIPVPADGVIPVHTALPGRLRAEVRGLRGNAALARGLEATLGGAGIRSVQASAVTGRMLVLYDAALPQAEVVGRIARARAAPTVAGGTPQLWHCHTPEHTLAEVTSRPQGLTGREAAARLSRQGANVLPAPPRRSTWEIVLSQYISLPVGLLAVSALISVCTGGVADAAIIAAVLLLNGTLGAWTELSAERTIASMEHGEARPVRVRRDGRMQILDAALLVPGDVVVLGPGERVAADARLLSAHGLSADESLLTGESLPAAKSAATLTDARLALGDRADMVWRGTLIAAGRGEAVVVATGQATEIGRIQSLVGSTEAPRTPLQVQLDQLGRKLVGLSGLACAAVFVLGLLRGFSIAEMFRSSIALAVAAIPEGLPTIATTTLAFGIRDMRRHRVLVRHLAAVETLGAMQVVCFDKTGTLTQNRMTVTSLHVEGQDRPPQEWGEPAARRLLEAAALCNDAGTGKSGQPMDGSATETALLLAATRAGVALDALRQAWPRQAERPRGDDRRFMATLHRAEDGRFRLAVKGSPDEVLALCHLEAPALADARQANHRMAGAGLRVLGVAEAEADTEAPTEEGRRLRWLGLVGMQDPLRPGMDKLVARLERSGIRTVMLTGDQPATARAVAAALGLGNGAMRVVDGPSMAAMGLAQMAEAARDAQVFARISPADKLSIVRALQAPGAVVGMTGDGVNDGPALRAADVGVAMGQRGTEAARRLADVVLEDDDPRAMVEAVRRGRAIYANIRKSLHFLIATNLSEILLMLAATAAGLGRPLNTAQLLWINLVSDVLPGLALSLEPPAPDILDQPPRPARESVLPSTILARMAGQAAVMAGGGLAAYGWGLARYGSGLRATTLASTSLVTAQMLHALTCRSGHSGLFMAGKRPANPRLTAALAGTFAAQGLALAVPWLRHPLGLAPLGVVDIGVAALAGVVPYLVNEAVKAAGEFPPLPTLGEGAH